MRLIDADEVKRFYEEDFPTVDNGVHWSRNDIIMNLSNIPTVNAIPIDKPFLKMRYGDYVVYNKKWLVNHLQTEWDILQGKEYQPSIPIEWIRKMMDKYKDWEFDNFCESLIETWEKENEQVSSKN